VANTAESRTLSTVHGINFVELEAKAVGQWEPIEERRHNLVARTFSLDR
jgi:hypothetical protein